VRGVVVDFLFPKGHKELNKKLILYFADILNVTVLVDKEYLDQEFDNNENITTKKIKIKKSMKNAFLSRLNAFRNMVSTHRSVDWKQFDFVWVNTFETISFAIGYKLINNKNIYIMHHNNTDELSNRIKRLFFNTYKNKVKHVVFEDFIKDYLVNSIGVKKSSVIVIPHPQKSNIPYLGVLDNKMCVGLSNSNDKSIVNQIVKEEILNKTFSENGIEMVMKSTDEYQCNFLRVFSGFLGKEDYDKYINESTFVLAPFNANYKFRTSGFIIDALANEKIIIGSNIPLMRAYARKYPHICYYFNEIHEIPDIILNASNKTEVAKREFSEFRHTHSDLQIKGNMKRALGIMS